MRTRTRVTLAVGIAVLLLGATVTVDAALPPTHPLGLRDVEKTIRSIDLQQELIDFTRAPAASPTTLTIASPPASGHAFINGTTVAFLPDLQQNTTVRFTASVHSLTDQSKTDAATFTYHVRGLGHADTVTPVAPGGAASYDVATSFVGYPVGPVSLTTTGDDEAEQAAGLLTPNGDGSADWRPSRTAGVFHIDYDSGAVTFTADRGFTGEATYRYRARVGSQLVDGSATFRAVPTRVRPRVDVGLRPVPVAPLGGDGSGSVRFPAGSAVSVSASVNPAAGSASASLDDTGKVLVVFSPAAGFAGDAVVSVTGSAPDGDQSVEVMFPVTGSPTSPVVDTDPVSGVSTVDAAASLPPGAVVTGAVPVPAGAGSAVVGAAGVSFTPTPGFRGSAAVAVEYSVAGKPATMTVSVPGVGGGAGGSGGGFGGGAGGSAGGAGSPSSDPGKSGSGLASPPGLAFTGSAVNIVAVAAAVGAIWVGALLVVVARRRRAAASTGVPEPDSTEETTPR